MDSIPAVEGKLHCMLMYLYVVLPINISLKKKRKKRLKIENTRFNVFKHKGGIYKTGLRSNQKFLHIKMPGT